MGQHELNFKDFRATNGCLNVKGIYKTKIPYLHKNLQNKVNLNKRHDHC